MSEQRYRQNLKCHHCLNTVTMPIVADYSQVRDHEADNGAMVWAEGNVYEVLRCPACDGVTFQRGYFHDQFPDEWQPVVLYPIDTKKVDGLPPAIERAYTAALAVKSIEAHAREIVPERVGIRIERNIHCLPFDHGFDPIRDCFILARKVQ